MKLYLSIFLCFSSLAFCTSKDEAITPKQALENLLKGNTRYAEDHALHADTSAMRRESTSASQKPFAIILGCSDSRVPPEIIFDQGMGDLFVVRVAGNVAGPTEIDSIEYAVNQLGCSLIMVLGHENCGAVKATVDGALGKDDHLGALIEPAIKNCKELKQCIEANIHYVSEKIRSFPFITSKLKEGKLTVVEAYYDLNSGKIKLLD